MFSESYRNARYTVVLWSRLGDGYHGVFGHRDMTSARRHMRRLARRHSDAAIGAVVANEATGVSVFSCATGEQLHRVCFADAQ